MVLIRGLVIAFAMYSKIPMPRVEWDKQSMRFALCFLPLVGGVVGGVQAGWWFAANALGVQPLLYASIAVALPILITGGIHLDGLIDTSDARASYGDPDKKRAILDDPHTGAFGVIHCAVYLLVLLGLFVQLFVGGRLVWILALGYPLSRSIAGVAILVMRSSKQEGLVHTFVGFSQRTISITTVLVFGAFCALGMVWIAPLCGTILLAGQGLLLLWWQRMTRRQFGGVSGDLAGYLVQLSELVTLGAIVLYSFL